MNKKNYMNKKLCTVSTMKKILEIRDIYLFFILKNKLFEIFVFLPYIS